ncbi:MAG: hypothetical protein ABIR38_00270 [Chthoniobacterales bacterium]
MKMHRSSATRLILILALAFSLGTLPNLRAQEDGGGIQQAMTPSEFKSAGLEKLSPEEIAKLNAWLQGFREKAEKKAALRESRTKLDFIVSRIDGVWNGVGPGQIIALEDGTKWKLGNKDEHYGGQADHPAVAIFKSIFGWKMRVSRIAEFYVVPVK